MTIDRQCSSGMMAIATAAKQIIHDGMQVAIGGGLESISLVQKQANEYTPNDRPGIDRKASAYLHADVANCRSGC